MNAPTALEDRVRRGLRAAADALPEAPLVPPAPGDARPPRRRGPRPSWRPMWRPVPLVAAAAAVVVALVGVVVVTRTGGSDDDPSVRVGSPGQETETGDPHQVRPANGRAPGRAVVVNPGVGSTSELRTYDAGGAQTGTVDLAPLEDVQAARSDLDGGWIACGLVPAVVAWFPPEPEEEPVPPGPGPGPDYQSRDEARIADRLEQLQEQVAEAAAAHDAAELEALEEQRVALEAEAALARVQADAVRAGTDTEPTTTGPPATVTVPSSVGGDTTPTTAPATTVPESSREGTTTTVVAEDGGHGYGRVDQLMWFPAGRAPVVVETPALPQCLMDDTMQVVDSPEGATVVYVTLNSATLAYEVHAVALATGQDRAVPLPIEEPRQVHMAASTGRIAVVGEAGLQLFDLATGASVPLAQIDVPAGSEVALAPDATSIAVMGGVAGNPAPGDVVVYDVATGAERFRETFPVNLEGADLSYDGTTLAVGNLSDDRGATTVVDLPTGARHTLDASGVLP